MTNTDDREHRSILQGIAHRATLERKQRISTCFMRKSFRGEDHFHRDLAEAQTIVNHALGAVKTVHKGTKGLLC